MPFGSYRAVPASGEITDRGFTGHKHNDGLGLIYMQARYYVPYIYRMLTPDTIVPDYTNPQTFNRYSYARNNPVNFTDPTGHRECEFDDHCGPLPPPVPPPPAPLILFGGVDGQTWANEEKLEVILGAWQVARALFEASGGQFSSPREAFLTVYGGQVTFYKTGEECDAGCWGEHIGPVYGIGDRVINVYTNAHDGRGFDITSEFEDGFSYGELWAVHELGHAFEARLADEMGVWGPARTALRRATGVTTGEGFAGDYPGWRMSPHDTDGEEFADSFIGWAYDRWEADALGLTVEAIARRDFMQQNMNLWVDQFGVP